MDQKKKTWIIVIVVLVLFALVGSCGDKSKSKDGELVTGYCSHCHGAGVTQYGNECGWCNGTGIWAFYK